MEETSFIIGGDTVINKKISSKKITNEDLSKLFLSHNYRILNLEAPITTSTSPILKTGPNLKASEEQITRLKSELGINVFTLANNHIYDYGREGVLDTIKYCKNNKITHIGAGNNIESAAQTCYVKHGSNIVGIVNITENEWSSADEENAGASGFNLIDNFWQIKEASEIADCVFVIYHGGHEYYNLPSPRIQKLFRFFVDMGANIVVSHHTHCISGFENYKNAPIYYGLGNFLFTSGNRSDQWNHGMIISVKFQNNVLSHQPFFVRNSIEKNQLQLLTNHDNHLFMKKIEGLNQIIRNPILLRQNWERYVDNTFNNYINYISPTSFITNKYIRGGLRYFNFKFLSELGVALRLNLTRCESHLDLTVAASKRYLRK